MLTQTWAMLVDAYRELCARKLFWISLILSGVVVAAFAAVGINENGFQILWFELPTRVFNTKVLPRETFYSWIYTTFGIGMWLTWAAAILALVTTAGFFPNLIEAGAIEVHLSKPISRTRLFLTRYFTGLLFVALQVAVFAVASYLVLGLRGGVWKPTVLLAIPIVVLFFSYLYGVCVLLGVLTRSTIAALLLTVLFWFLVFIVNAADQGFVSAREQAIIDVNRTERSLNRLETGARKLLVEQKTAGGEEVPESWQPTDEELLASMPLIKVRREELEDSRKSAATWTKVTRYIFWGKTVLPKTGETTGLLSRYMFSQSDMDALLTAFTGGPRDEPEADEDGGSELDANRAVQAVYNKRSMWWIVGTSLIFEAVVVGLAGLVFVRRDY